MASSLLLPRLTGNAYEAIGSDSGGKKYGYAFAGWLFVRTAIWTAVTWLTLQNAPPAIVEALSWGREWQWGNPKHPPLLSWLAEAAWNAAGGSMLGVHFLGYALLGLTSWSVWRLARLVLPAREALLAALCMEGIWYYTYWGYRLDHNIALTAFWSLTVLFVYQAVTGDRLVDWLAAGACAGLGLLAKYSMLFILISLLAWMFFDRRGMRAWRRPGPYAALLLMLLIVAPHLVWSAREGWPNLAYGQNRAVSPAPNFAARIVEPLSFLFKQGLALLPLGFVLGYGVSRCPQLPSGKDRKAAVFLGFVIGGPLLLHVGLGVGLGFHLGGAWGTPFWAFFGLLVLLLFRIASGIDSGRRMIWGLLACNVAALLFLAGRNVFWPADVGIHFQGKLLATQASRRWTERFGTPLPAVSGDIVYAGNIGLYAPGRPHAFSSADPCDETGWYGFTAAKDDERMNRYGGLIVWDVGRSGPEIPRLFIERFPAAQQAEPIHIKGAVIGVAAIPP